MKIRGHITLGHNAYLLALVLDAQRWPDIHAPLLNSHRR